MAQSQRSIAPLAFRSDKDDAWQMYCPADKSLTHRAIMFAAMAKGVSRVFRPLLGEDCVSTINSFRKLGVTIAIVKSSSDDEGFLKIESPGWNHWHTPRDELDFGNSGTTARLMIGLLAATPNLNVSCKGDGSLSRRPMLRVVTPLRSMGAVISGHDDGATLPLRIEGQQLTAKRHTLDKASAQIKSSLMLAALNCDGTTTITLPAGARDHTERFLLQQGVDISVEQSGESEKITLAGPYRPKTFDKRVPGDPSSAAFFVALAILAPPSTRVSIKDVLVNPTRTGFVEVLRQAYPGIKVEQERQDDFMEPVCDLHISGGLALSAMQISSHQVPSLVDEIPVLAVLAMFADGESVFEGLEELRVKESDRLSTTASLIKRAGGTVEVKGDTMIISGRPNHKTAGFHFNPEGDHRLAMAASILAARSTGEIVVEDAHCVEVSFPQFYQQLDNLRQV